MKFQYEWRTMKMRKQSFRPARACVALAMGVAAAFSASTAMAVPILFPFTDGNGSGSGNALLLQTAFDNQNADGTKSATIDGLVITSVNAAGPRYTDGTTTWNWNGIDFSSSTSTPVAVQKSNIAGSGTGVGLSIDNPVIGGGSGAGTESTHFNAGESWTIKFDQTVIFNEFELVSFNGAETIRVTVGSSVFDFIVADTTPSGSNLLINSTSSSSDPLFSFAIPANTNITISNSNTPPLSQTKSVEFTSQWRLRSFTVTPVPEPSHMMLIGIGTIALGVVRLRQRK